MSTAQQFLTSRLYAWLEANPAGLAADEAVPLFNTNLSKAAAALGNLRDQKRIVSRPAPYGKAKRRLRYFHPTHAPQAESVVHMKRSRMSFADGMNVVESRKFTGVAITPFPPDKRFHVERVEPFFGAMAPGSYLQNDSAIARAYGGEK